jgi:hypothetical protein
MRKIALATLIGLVVAACTTAGERVGGAAVGAGVGAVAGPVGAVVGAGVGAATGPAVVRTTRRDASPGRLSEGLPPAAPRADVIRHVASSSSSLRLQGGEGLIRPPHGGLFCWDHS